MAEKAKKTMVLRWSHLLPIDLQLPKKLKASKDYLGKGLALFLYKKMNEITNACIEGNPLSDNYRNVQFNQHCGYSIVQSRCYMTRFSESLK